MTLKACTDADRLIFLGKSASQEFSLLPTPDWTFPLSPVLWRRPDWSVPLSPVLWWRLTRLVSPKCRSGSLHHLGCLNAGLNEVTRIQRHHGVMLSFSRLGPYRKGKLAGVPRVCPSGLPSVPGVCLCVCPISPAAHQCFALLASAICPFLFALDRNGCAAFMLRSGHRFCHYFIMAASFGLPWVYVVYYLIFLFRDDYDFASLWG